ncbi:MAG: hypothetical protein JST59_29345 [Actinobacteria bacterium]|nr:hypothetical protein [Actinomycetota bacterium]
MTAAPPPAERGAHTPTVEAAPAGWGPVPPRPSVAVGGRTTKLPETTDRLFAYQRGPVPSEDPAVSERRPAINP